MRKWMAPLAFSLALSLVGIGAAVPASAQSVDSPNIYQDRPNVHRREDLSSRADGIRDRAQRMMEDGRLTRDHYDRIVGRLGRVFNDVDNHYRIHADRFHSDQRYMDSVEGTLARWHDEDSVRFHPRDFDDRD